VGEIQGRKIRGNPESGSCKEIGVTGDTALRLAHFFGTSAEFWLNLQSLYEIRLAEQRSGKSIRALPTLKRFEQVHA
jgi:plasmid maintenance system antidote protein VapI